VDAFFARHGGKAILVGRFVGVVRAVAPFVAGASRLPLRGFLPWSLLGTALWAAALTLVGYAFHQSFSAAADVLTHAALALALVAAAAFSVHALRRRRALA
jgi:membrane protein DedA with SNARE-associated domain